MPGIAFLQNSEISSPAYLRNPIELPLTLIWVNPAFSSRSFADCTAWNARNLVRSDLIYNVDRLTSGRSVEKGDKVLGSFQRSFGSHVAEVRMNGRLD